jgi:hypothetical protein
MEPTMPNQVAAPVAPAAPLSALTYQADFTPTLSRLFIFRGLCLLVEYWVLIVWMIWIELNLIVDFLYMFFMGRRMETIWRRKLRFMRHLAKWQAYLLALTDQRPQWIEE